MSQAAIIGVDLGATKISVGRVEKGRIVKRISRAVSAMGSQKQVLHEILLAIEKIFSTDIAGMGVGVPSLVDVDKGIVYEVQNIRSWKKVPLRRILEDRFLKPVYVNNDANCFAVGEKYFGKGRKYRNFVGLTLGSGLGAGIIINNRLYTGRNCGAGEFGTIPYRDAILERYSSGQFFMSQYGLRGDQIYARAKKGNKTALNIFKQYGKHLGDALMIIMLAVDPEAIILGGSVSAALPFFEKPMRERMKIFPYAHALSRLVIEKSTRPQIAVLGAAALFLEAQCA